MINFSCRCGHAFSVQTDLAGGLIQCPQCKRLNDVPGLNDLADVEPSGIYRLEERQEPRVDPNRVQTLSTVFTRDRFDQNGNPIDLRGQISGDGSSKGPVPVESLGPLDKAAPKYDPITGELIRDIDVKPPDALPVEPIPVAQAVVITPTVVNGMDIPTAAETLAIPFRLLEPMNLLVQFFVFLAHMLGLMMMAAIASFYWPLVPFWFILHLLIVSHFANVVDEIGPTSHSELPTPLRHVAWHDDTAGPMFRVLLAVGACFGPAILVLMNGEYAPAKLLMGIAGIFGLGGLFLFPAALITTITSGSILNLRPDRVVGVIVACGIEYFIVLFVGVAGIATWVFGTYTTSWIAASSLSLGGGAIPKWLTWYLAFGSLIVGIYLMHWFTYYLGLLYRKHYARFPWVFQHHIRNSVQQAKGFPVQRPPRRVRPVRSN